MVFFLLWFFFLAAAVTWYAAALATPVYVSNAILRHTTRVVLAAVPAAACAGLVFIAGYARKKGWIAGGDFRLAFGLAVLFVVAAVVSLSLKFWRQVPPGGSRRPIRRRTVAALYGLALMFVALHVYVLQIAPSAVTAEIDTLIAPAQARCETWLQREMPARDAALALHQPDDPADAAGAYVAFFEPEDPAVQERRKAFQYRMNAIHQALFLDRRDFDQPVTLHGYLTLGTPEDDIAETPAQTLERFAPDLEALRAIAHLEPLYAAQSLTRLRQRSDAFRSYELSDYARWFQVTGAVALHARQFDRAASEMETLAALMRQTQEVHGLLNHAMLLSVEFGRQNLAEQWLNTPDLIAADLDRLILDPGEVGIDQQRCDLDFGEWQVLMDNREATGKPPVFFTPTAMHSGYLGWLGGIYLPRGRAQQYVAVAAELRGWLGDPLPWPATRWEADANRWQDGDAGRALRGLAVVNFRMAHLLAARWRMLQAGKAAMQYRLRTGRFPATLAALVPADLPAEPSDPFSAQPFQVKVEDGGMWIWSVGAENPQPDWAGTDWYFEDAILPLGAAFTRREKGLREQEEADRVP